MNIAEPLMAHAMSVDDLDLWDNNPRKGDLQAVKNSLERFGQRAPIIYRSEIIDGEERKVVYAGNHRLQAARQLGWEQVAAIAADDLTPDEIRAFALADNRTGDLGTYDDQVLAELLMSLPDDGDLLAATGYDPQAMDKLLSAFPDPDRQDFYVNEIEEAEEIGDIETNNECPKCHFQW